MRIHKNNVHSIVEYLPCNICHNTFKGKRSLKRHQEKCEVIRAKGKKINIFKNENVINSKIGAILERKYRQILPKPGIVISNPENDCIYIKEETIEQDLNDQDKIDKENQLEKDLKGAE